MELRQPPVRPPVAVYNLSALAMDGFAHIIKSNRKRGRRCSELENVHVEKQVRSLDSTLLGTPCTFLMYKFEQHKRDSDKWSSKPFYTAPQGYRLNLCVYANGYGDGKDTHVSIFLQLMPGEFDNRLRWPFRGSFTVTLLDQSNSEQGSGEEESDSEQGSGEEESDSKHIGEEEESDSEQDGEEEESDSEQDGEEEESDSEQDCKEEESDSEQDCEEEESDNEQGSEEEEFNNKQDGEEEESDSEQNIEKEISFSYGTPDAVVGRPRGRNNVGLGEPKFVSHHTLRSQQRDSPVYVKDNCICIQVTKNY